MGFLTNFFDGFVLGVLLFNPAGGAVAFPLVVDKVAWCAPYAADCTGSESVES